MTPQDKRSQPGIRMCLEGTVSAPSPGGGGEGCCCDLGCQWPGAGAQRETDLNSGVLKALFGGPLDGDLFRTEIRQQ